MERARRAQQWAMAIIRGDPCGVECWPSWPPCSRASLRSDPPRPRVAIPSASRTATASSARSSRDAGGGAWPVAPVHHGLRYGNDGPHCSGGCRAGGRCEQPCPTAANLPDCGALCPCPSRRPPVLSRCAATSTRRPPASRCHHRCATSCPAAASHRVVTQLGRPTTCHPAATSPCSCPVRCCLDIPCCPARPGRHPTSGHHPSCCRAVACRPATRPWLRATRASS